MPGPRDVATTPAAPRAVAPKSGGAAPRGLSALAGVGRTSPPPARGEPQAGGPLGRRTIALVQESWASVMPISDAAATLFYDRLFALDPSLRVMFKSDLGEQKKKLMQTLSVAVDGLTNLPKLVPVLQALGERHAGYLVTEVHYDLVGEALLWTLREGLGDGYTDEIEAAWKEVYGLVADTMKKAAAGVAPPRGAAPARAAAAAQAPPAREPARAQRAAPAPLPPPAKAEGPLGRRTIALVQESWASVMPISDAAATLFYDRLFALDPSLRAMFKSDLGEQKKKLMQTLSVAVDGLTNLPKLVPVLEALGRRHVGYMVTEAHYDLVGEALLWTLREGLGDAYTGEVETAWKEVYGLVAGTMKNAAAGVAPRPAEPREADPAPRGRLSIPEEDFETLHYASQGRGSTPPDPTATLRESGEPPPRRPTYLAEQAGGGGTRKGSEPPRVGVVGVAGFEPPAVQRGSEPARGAAFTAAGSREAETQRPAGVLLPLGQDATIQVNVKLDVGPVLRALEARAPEPRAPGGVVPAILLSLLCLLGAGGAAAAVGLSAGAPAALVVGVPLGAALLAVAAFALGFAAGRGGASDRKGAGRG